MEKMSLFSYFLHECLQDNKYIIKLGLLVIVFCCSIS